MKFIHIQTLTIVFLFLNLVANGIHAQVDWEEGFFVKNDGSKVDCLIKNRDWKNNPVSFEYKFSASEKPKTATIEEVQRFVINNAGKYIRHTVMIDISSDKIGKLSEDSDPIFKKQTIFLKVLVEGAANLYKYENGTHRRFFYSTSDSVEPLIYKRYIIEDDKVRRNNMFQQQLWKNIRCEDLQMTEVLKLPYYEKDLINYFIDYSECKNSLYTVYNTVSDKRTYFNVNVGSGVSQLTILNYDRFRVYKNKLAGNIILKLGAELEHYLPFNNRKWSLFLSPSLTKFNARGEYISLNDTHHEATVSSLSLDVISGLRHSLYLSDAHQFFFTAGVLAYFPISGSLDVDGIREFPLSYSDAFIIGAGFKFKDKYSIDINYNFDMILTRREIYELKYSYIGLQIGYSLAKF